MEKTTKDKIFYLSITIICLLLVLFLGNFFSNFSRAVGNNAVFENRTIIIDAGHGGEDGGAVAADGTLEKEINLKIAKKLNETLSSAGFKTVMTRAEDKAIYNLGSENKTLRKKKIEDLNNRLKIANSCSNNVLVSIHQNKFSDQNYSGTQIFYSVNNKYGELLAKSIKDAFNKTIQPENSRENKKAGKEIFLLNNAKIPAVVVECGFLSNSEELKKLISEEYQKSVANCIFEGIKNFLLTFPAA